jgi:dUTP pyrophosphatase
MIKYVKLHADAPDFIRPNDGDAGYDLRSNEDVTLWSYDWTAIGTGIAIQIPRGYVGFIRGRSGLAFKGQVFSFDGTIDSVYRGEWKLLVKLDPNNYIDEENNTYSYQVKRGEKIAQVVFVPYLDAPVELVDRLDETERGSNGFGSTGA